MRSYDLETGEIVWESDGLTMNPIPSPVFGDGLVFVTSGFQGNDSRRSASPTRRGDITGTSAIVWTLDRDTPYVPSPLLYDGILYFLKTTRASCRRSTRRPARRTSRSAARRRARTCSRRRSAARGRVYFAGREGTTLVIRYGPTFEVLAKNTLDDGFDASPALVDNEIFLRGNKSLYCISE